MSESPDAPAFGEGFDELVARATSSSGAPALDPELEAEWPAAWLGTPGHAAVPPAGYRDVRRPAATAGEEARARHNWVPIGPRNVAGRMRAIVCGDPGNPDPQVWFAASAGGGVWRSRNAGRRWEPVPDWHTRRCLVVGAMAVAPSDPHYIYAATGEACPAGPNTLRGAGVFVSTDGGDTWDNHRGSGANPVHRGGFEALAVDPGNEKHAWAVGVDGAFRTLDGGVTWDPPYAAGTYFSDVAFTRDRRLLLVRGKSAAGEGAVIRIAAPDAAAALVAAEFADAASVSVVIAPRPPRAAWPASGKIAVATATTAYCRFADEDDRHAGIFRTANLNAPAGSSITWARLADHGDFLDDGQGVYNLCLAVDPAAPNRVVTGAVHLHVSTNALAAPGSVTWKRIMSWPLHQAGLRGHHADQHGLAIAGSPAQLWVANDGGIARATPNWPDPAKEVGWERPQKPGSVGWQRRDVGIQGAQTYDLAQSPLLRGVLATGLQDHGTYLRSGGQTWRSIMGADGAFCAFDPDDPYRLDVSFYGGLVSMQFPALRDTQFPDDARDLRGTATSRMLADGMDDDSPFTPETARDPQDTGRVLHARRGRLYGSASATGERFSVEPVGRSFVLRVRLPPAPGGPATRLPRPLRPLPPPPPEPRVVVEIADTAGAGKLGLLPGRGARIEHVEVTDHDRLVIASRLPGPYQLAEGDDLRITIDGTTYQVAFTAADGLDLAKVTVPDVVRVLTAKIPAGKAEVLPSLWRTPFAVQLVTQDAGPAASLRLSGDALDPLPDGLSRLGINRGTYGGDGGRPASVLLSLELAPNRDFSGPVRTLEVAINGGATRSLRIEPPDFPDPANVTAGELAAALAKALVKDPVHVHAVPSRACLVLLAEAGHRVVLTGTAAERMSLPKAGAPAVRLGVFSRTVDHLKRHVRNFAGVDLTPAGPPLELVISDGTTATAPLTFTAADVADLRAVTVEELHGLISRQLAASPAVKVRADLLVTPAEGCVSQLTFGPPPSAAGGGPAAPSAAWAGGQDGSVFVTRDGGRHWLDVTNPQMRLGDREIEAIAVHPTDPRTAWVGLSGEAAVPADPPFVFRTRDGGETWQPVGHKVAGGAAEGIVTGAGVPLGVNALELDPADPAVLFAATDAGVFRSIDAGDTWAPFSEGLPNAQVVDLVSHAEQRVLRASLWTRGVWERRIDPGPPDDVRLVIRATELDDGYRPARAAPSFGTAAAAPVTSGSPDIKVVRRRAAGLGTDADVDGVTFDFDVPHDDIVPGSTTTVMIQVTNTGPTPVPPPGALPAERARVVLLWAPVDEGIPPLPANLWARIALGPLAGTAGAWTVDGDAPIPRTVPGGDTGIVAFSVTWPALAGVGSVGLLALTTAVADPLTGGPLTVPELLAVERRAAFREVPVRRPDDDRALVVRATGTGDIVVENVAEEEGISVGGQLGFADGVLGVRGRIRLATAATGDERNLRVPPASPKPAIAVRSAAPVVADLTLAPAADEARNPAAVHPAELVRMLNRRFQQAGLPLTASNPPAGFVLRGTGGATLRASGPAAPRLGFPAGGAAVPELSTSRDIFHFDLTGTPSLTLTVVLAGGNVPVPVDLSPRRFMGSGSVPREAVARAVIDDLRLAGAEGVVSVRMLTGVGLRGAAATAIAVSGAARGLIGLPAGPELWLTAAPAPLDLTAGPALHIEVTPRVVVRFDADPADIPDLARAQHPDIRRAISLACELAEVPARAEVPVIDLRIAASPEDAARRHPVLGGAQLAELAASDVAVAEAGRPGLFPVRSAIGHDVIHPGVANHLYLRVRNAGNVDSAKTRLRLFRLDLATPITRTEVASATALPVPASAVHIQELSWDPGGPAPRSELLLCVADDDRPGRQIEVPPTFPGLESVHAFASHRPGVALRLLDVVAAGP